jgi:hypothetical protein
LRRESRRQRVEEKEQTEYAGPHDLDGIALDAIATNRSRMRITAIAYDSGNRLRYNMYEKHPCSHASPVASSCLMSIDSSWTCAK